MIYDVKLYDGFLNLEIMDVVWYFLYAPYAYFLVYFYDRWRIRGITTLFYLIGFSFFGICKEWICLRFGVYTNKGWNLVYSFTVYFYSQALLLLLYRMAMSHYKKTKLPGR
jgi:hypothetical protein